jgi:hypothetical protein
LAAQLPAFLFIQLSAGRGNPVDGIARNLLLDFRGASVSAAASGSAQVAWVPTVAAPQDPIWGSVTVTDLVSSLGWRLERVRSALDECVRLNCVTPSWGAPENLRAVGPEVALQALVTRRENELLERQKELAEARTEVARFIDDHNAAQQDLRGSVIERLNGLEEIHSRIEELTQNCGAELLTFAAGGPQTAESRQASRPLCEDLAGRGAAMRSVYLDSVHNDPATVEHLRWLHSHGDEVRTTVSLPSRMLVSRRGLLLATNAGPASATRTCPPTPTTATAAVAHLRAAYRSATTRFDWQRDDILIVDNMLARPRR